MTEVEFFEKLCELFMRLDNDWDFGNDLKEDIRRMATLCEKYLKQLNGEKEK